MGEDGAFTFNAPERTGAFFGTANGRGTMTLKVTCLSSTNPPVDNGDTPPCNANPDDQVDVKITADLADVRCVGTAGQSNCAGGAGSLYGGEVLLRTTVRITDLLNGSSQSDPGTVSDTPLNVGFQCSGGACSITTSADAVYPDLAQERKRAIWELGQVVVLDGGPDGALDFAPVPPASGLCPPACVGNAGETEFLRQGLFAP